MAASLFSQFDRKKSLDSLSQSRQLFDICVIGGGITGAAIARDCQLRGLSVLLVEKDDFAQGTSSRSSKLVHGGVRYLEQYEFGLVAESTRERALLWKNAPHLVTPMPFLFPTFTGSRLPLWQLRAGLWLYDMLALFRLPGLHRTLSKAKTLEAEPALKADGLKGSVFYWDGATDDAMLTLSNILDASRSGAKTFSRVSLEGIEWNALDRVRKGEGHLLKLKDLETGKSLEAAARVVVSAAGPWTDGLLSKVQPGGAHTRKLLAPTRGSHIVVPASRLPTTHAVVVVHPTDARVLFSIPFEDCTVLGTTDLFDKDSPDHTVVTSDEIDYLLAAGNDYYPKVNLTRDDVISTWAGLRPLLAPPDAASASAISREHHLEWSDPGLIVIAGGKLTTHREMARQTAELIFAKTTHWDQWLGRGYEPDPTIHRPLPTFNRPVNVLEPTSDEIKTILMEEMVLGLEDFMVRRLPIFYRCRDNGLGLIDRIKPVFQQTLGWSDAKWLEEVQHYLAYVNRNVNAPLGRKLL